ncbi:hypothetical protein K469DRAFT_744639 [Zopfia rhizophila CBS 207.26]|uniref:Uncharacterized protein n=1 Tax=Zopfia rhizophila CBS 207.26 TaxID=1314779 RepID=A0A6A6EVR5_9PEZI|nr:hypothetical protein K469DRAFT_744639 [Zopfia rhizophila CBS 207.26]
MNGFGYMFRPRYAKYAKSGIPFLILNIRNGPILVIPPSQLKSILGNPERIVEALAPRFENVSTAYTMRDPNIYLSSYGVDLVRKQITKWFSSMAQELAEEVLLAFDEYWGRRKSGRPFWHGHHFNILQREPSIILLSVFLSNEILQWLIEEGYITKNPGQVQSRRITHHLVMLNFDSVPPAGLTLPNALLDLYSAPPSEGFVETLRAECDKVLHGTPERYWTNDMVLKLHLVDSAVRESMRHSDFGSLAFASRVGAQGGIDIGGVKVP